MDEGDSVWLAMETSGRVEAGTPVTLDQHATVKRDRALVPNGSGGWFCAQRVRKDLQEGVMEQYRAGGNLGDARLLEELVHDATGRRHVEFAQGVRMMRQEDMVDFPLKGERSAQWLMQYIVAHGGTPDGRQTKWSAERRVDTASSAFITHDLVGMALE
eukprot:6466639-Amphidinium_carterae.1